MEAESLCQCGAATVDDILARLFRVDVSKALNPLDDSDYLIIVGRLTRALVGVTKEDEAKSLNKALGMLDVNWANMTEAGRDKVISAAQTVIKATPAGIVKPVVHELTVAAPKIVTPSKKGTVATLPAKFRANVNVSFELRDKRITDHMARSQALFIRDEYGRRSERFSVLARDIVAEGLDKGLGRDDIAEDLDRRIRASIGLEKSRDYWNTIAGVFTNRSRTWGQLSSYQDAGIKQFIFSAVLDEVTTDQCRSLDGQVFTVDKGIEKYEAVEDANDGEAVKDLMPWIQKGTDEDGNEILYVKNRDGERKVVANVRESAVGTKDKIGKYDFQMSVAEIEAVGCFMPPLHGKCRSTVQARV